MLNGKFSVAANPSFETFSYILSPGTTPLIEIKIGDFTLIKKGKDLAGTLELRNKNGQIIRNYE
jgi:hypothetical protein